MKSPGIKEEKKLWRTGYNLVAGLDEAGRGPLAGPVVAAAVCIKKSKIQSTKSQINPKFKYSKSKTILNFGDCNLFGACNFEFEILGVKDSKQLSSKKREEIYKAVIKNPNIEWGIGRISEKTIDKINILEAAKLAMVKAIANLNFKFQNPNVKKNPKPKIQNIDHLMLDGNFAINSKIPQRSIIKADEKIFSVALASIIAKVTRDKIMANYHKKYPKYGFDRHKGYPTKHHRAMIKQYGLCEIHRKSFKLI